MCFINGCRIFAASRYIVHYFYKISMSLTMAGGATNTVLRAVQCPCSSCAIMKSFGAIFFSRPDALPGISQPHSWDTVSNSL